MRSDHPWDVWRETCDATRRVRFGYAMCLVREGHAIHPRTRRMYSTWLSDVRPQSGRVLFRRDPRKLPHPIGRSRRTSRPQLRSCHDIAFR